MNSLQSGNPKNNRLRVSVIVPVHNGESTLKRCLDSILGQTLQPDEVFVVNDGSTDDTERIAHSYGQRIQYILQGNQGAGAARTRGMELATGDYVAFLDADDYWLPEFLETCAVFLDTHETVVAVLTSWRKVLSASETLDVPAYLHECPELGGLVLPSFFEFWRQYGFVQTGAIMLRGSVAKQAGGMLPDLWISQDLEYWALIGTMGSWGFIPKVLYVNDSKMSVGQGGTRSKYSRKRQNCPSVETWCSRVEPLIADDDRTDYNAIKGQVAAGYLYAKAAIGDACSVHHIMTTYEVIMPKNPVIQLLRVMKPMWSFGGVGLVCALVGIWERMKSFR